MLLKIYNNIIKTQRDLARNVKILALRYLLVNNPKDEVQNLNIVIKCIMDSFAEDHYEFVSEATAEAAVALSMALVSSKKPIYNKFNMNLCTNMSSKYIPLEISFQEKEDSVKL